MCVEPLKPIVMKKLVFVIGFVFLLSSCATIAPLASSYYTEVPSSKEQLKKDIELISLSLISKSDKIFAEKILFEYYAYKTSLNNMVTGNDIILSKNYKLNNIYSTTNAIVGGVGGLSALATLLASWTVIVPVATGVWDLVGLGIQKYNIKPEIEKGEKLRALYLQNNGKFDTAREYFEKFVLNSNKKEAVKYYNLWKEETEKVLKEVSPIFERPDPFTFLKATYSTDSIGEK